MPSPAHLPRSGAEKPWHVADKGGDPEIVRESQRRRYADVGLVDRVLDLDAKWREGEIRRCFGCTGGGRGSAAPAEMRRRGRRRPSAERAPPTDNHSRLCRLASLATHALVTPLHAA